MCSFFNLAVLRLGECVSSPHLPIDLSLLIFYEYSDMTSPYVHSGSEWPNPQRYLLSFMPRSYTSPSTKSCQLSKQINSYVKTNATNALTRIPIQNLVVFWIFCIFISSSNKIALFSARYVHGFLLSLFLHLHRFRTNDKRIESPKNYI